MMFKEHKDMKVQCEEQERQLKAQAKTIDEQADKIQRLESLVNGLINKKDNWKAFWTFEGKPAVIE